MKAGKILQIDANNNHLSKLDYWWYNKYHTDSDYTKEDLIGVDINFHKHKNHGIELRIFDYFDESKLASALEFCVLILDHSLAKGKKIDSPVKNKLWNQFICDILKDRNVKISEEVKILYEDIFDLKTNFSTIPEFYEKIHNKLLKKYGNAKQLKKYLLLKPEDDGEQPKRTFIQVRLPKEYVSFKDASLGLKMTPQYKQAFNYIKKRNITDLMVQMYNIGFCYTGHYEHRIIIPSYDSENRLNYFIARSYLNDTKMKYKNPEVDKESLIWNEHLINWDEPVYIVEGAFDSIFLPNSIPMLGKFMTQNLFNKLYDNAKKVVIVLDPDAWEDAFRLYHKLNR
jgi:hypothetical protein